MTNYETILTKVQGKVGIITLNRPKAYNALNQALLTDIMHALETYDQDTAIGAMVLTGSEKAFVAGADIKEMADQSAVEMLESEFIPTFDRIQKIKKPIIAAVSGWALGGGSELALSCDMVVASETAKFGQPEITLGVIPGAGGTQRLARAVGKVLAMEMVLNNRTLNADEALHYRIVNHVFPVDQYLPEAIKLAREVASRAPLAVQLAKEAVNKAYEMSLSEGLEMERRAFNFLFSTKDQKEGMQAFVEKRQANWKGK